MLILGIETSTPAASVCLASHDGIVATAEIGPGLPELGRAHGSFVAPAISWCLDQAQRTSADVTGVAVSLGPGLFTGMRVGIATAQAFAHTRGLPMVGLPSLDLLAFPQRHVRRTLCSVIDARRGELFWALYRPSPGGVQRIGELRVGPADRLAADLDATGERVLVVGDTGVADRDVLDRVADLAAPSAPDAADLGELVHPRFVREDTQRPEQLAPLYLRQADASIGWQERGRLAGGEAAS